MTTLTLTRAATIRAVDEARDLPLDTRFVLGDEITPVQKAFLDLNGYLHFRGAASQDEVDTILSNSFGSGYVFRGLASFLSDARIPPSITGMA